MKRAASGEQQAGKINADQPARRSPLAARLTSDLLLPIATGAAAILLWHAAVRFSGTKIFPSPLEVARAIGQLVDQSLLWRYIGDSLARVACGYTLAVLLGVPLGIV